MRRSLLMKLFFSFIVVSVIVFLALFISAINYKRNNINLYTEDADAQVVVAHNVSMKYILQWTKPDTIPFIYMDVGQKGFLKRNCTFTNCYVTSNRKFLGDYDKFHVIAFHGPEVIRMSKLQLPTKRSPAQKYVFASIESSDYYPVCNNAFDQYFNWTWTYKLNSDEPFGYISIRDSKFNVIGPKTDMHWLKLEDMDEVKDELKSKLNSKTKAAAWLVSNCQARSKRQDFVKAVQEELRQYKLTVDVYGGCGSFKCPTENMDECLQKIERDYYFYFSFENSFSEDYVTEKLLHALQRNTVPVVYGGANYTRFMPDGIYLDGRQLGPARLASTMNDIMKDTQKYYQFFRWKNHYSYHDRSESAETDDYCRFCAMVNDKNLMENITVYQDFKKWWTPPARC